MRLTTAGAVLLLALAPACGGSEPTGPDGDGLPNGSFSARVDGSNYTATVAIVAQVTGGIVSIGTTNAAGQSIGFAWVDAGPNTYTVGSTSPTNGSYSFTGSGWAANVAGGSGSIIVTTKTANRVAGTFSFVMVPTSGAASGNKTITQGSFDLTF